jgi:hypothetical protein
MVFGSGERAIGRELFKAQTESKSYTLLYNFRKKVFSYSTQRRFTKRKSSLPLQGTKLV